MPGNDGDVTYTVVSPNHAPSAQMLTANGTDSTRVGILVVDKAGSAFPQNLLTLCTAYPPPPDEPFQFYALITPVGYAATPSSRLRAVRGGCQRRSRPVISIKPLAPRFLPT
jgi:hypothetical protein